jgi:hypothetical protein
MPDDIAGAQELVEEKRMTEIIIKARGIEERKPQTPEFLCSLPQHLTGIGETELISANDRHLRTSYHLQGESPHLWIPFLRPTVLGIELVHLVGADHRSSFSPEQLR